MKKKPSSPEQLRQKLLAGMLRIQSSEDFDRMGNKSHATHYSILSELKESGGSATYSELNSRIHARSTLQRRLTEMVEAEVLKVEKKGCRNLNVSQRAAGVAARVSDTRYILTEVGESFAGHYIEHGDKLFSELEELPDL